MIDYGFLCQAISDWREGRRPDAPPPAMQAMPAVQAVPTATSDAIEYEEVQDFEEASADEYEQAYGGQYPPQRSEFDGAGADRTQSYVPGGFSGAPDYVPRTGTPVAGTEVAAAEDEDLDVDVGDDDDFQRDYDLEDTDDFASFDPTTDLKEWFVARMRIEQAWEDRATRRKLFREFGIRNEQHFYQVQATMDRYVQSDDAADRYGGLDAIMQLQMNAHMDAAMGQQQARAQGELAGELAPFEDVSLQEWAAAQAKVASGGDVDSIIAGMGIDRAKWDRVSAEWNARMSRDTTATIAMEYGKAFSGAGQGAYGGAAAAGAGAMTPGGDVSGDPPIPFEQWIELEVAQSKGVEQGRDANEILASFGMNALAWSNASMWWSVHFNRHAMEDGQALLHRYNELRDQFEAQYSAGKADDDIDY
jgi:hypothetical protein